MPGDRTITLTDRPPVRIREDEWPVIAASDGDSWAGSDPSRHVQAQARGEVDTYMLKVRRHADGRSIVYAVVRTAPGAWGQPARGTDWRGGELVGSGVDVVPVIHRVGKAGGVPDYLIREAIAALPPETL